MLSFGATKPAEEAFLSVFQGINIATEAWLQSTKLMTVGFPRYASYVSGRIGTMALFGTSRTTQVDAAYVHVEVSAELEREKYRTVEEIANDLRTRAVMPSDSAVEDRSQRSPLEAIDATDNGFALLGTAGSGKTTVFRYLALSASKGTPIRGRRRLPLFFPVRDLTDAGQTLLQASEAFLEFLGIPEPVAVLNRLLESGCCVLLVDGLDETDRLSQRKLITELQDLAARYVGNIYCVSARPYSLSVGLPGFNKWEIRPLDTAERFAFIGKWFEAVDASKGSMLVDVCKEEPGLLDIGSSPLLLSIVCALYYNDLDVPGDRNELYSRALEGLMGGWDAFRNVVRTTVLSSYSLHKRMVLLTWLAAELYEAGQIVFSGSDVERCGCLNKASAALRCEPAEPPELLATLYSDFGILAERSPGLYSFSHLSLQEFLTAQYVVQQRREIQLISAHLDDPEWLSVFSMVAGALPWADQFLSSLHSKIAIHEPYHAKLLRQVWEQKPICSPEQARKVLTPLAARLTASAKWCRSEFVRSGSSVVVRPSAGVMLSIPRGLQTELKNADPKKRDARIENHQYQYWSTILNSLPDLHAAFAAAGCSYDDLGCPDSELYAVLRSFAECEIDYVMLEPGSVR